MEQPLEVYMRESDAFSWQMERDPILRSTVVAVAWLEHSPDWATLGTRLDRVTRLLPQFRTRPVPSPLPFIPPRWTVDPEFDLSWHLHRVEAPAPHTPETVMSLARHAAMTCFDPAHPLWEFTLVEGLTGGRAALVMKIHHSLTDGIGGMEMALLLFDRAADTTVDGPVPPAPPGESPGPAELVGGFVAYDWQRAAQLGRRAARRALPAAGRAVRHPARTAADVLETARSVARTVKPVLRPRSPVMEQRGLGRHLDMLTVELTDLRAAASAAGGTVNDAFLAAVTGGLRRYHERHGAVVDELGVTLPISIRAEGDPIGGNRITLQRFTVPVGTPDVAERVRGIHERCGAARHERSLPLTNAIAGTLNLLPPQVIGGMLKHVDFLTSDVPGFSFPVYLAGARMVGYFPFGPTIGASLNLTLLSYDGTCCVGVNIDTTAVIDVDVMMLCLREGFEEVLELSGAHRPPVLPLADSCYPGAVPASASTDGTGGHRSRRVPVGAVGEPAPKVRGGR